MMEVGKDTESYEIVEYIFRVSSKSLDNVIKYVNQTLKDFPKGGSIYIEKKFNENSGLHSAEIRRKIKRQLNPKY